MEIKQKSKIYACRGGRGRAFNVKKRQHEKHDISKNI